MKIVYKIIGFSSYLKYAIILHFLRIITTNEMAFFYEIDALMWTSIAFRQIELMEVGRSCER